MSTNQSGDSRRYPEGYRREGFPELWGWAEALAESGRGDFALRRVREQFPDDWPEPVGVLRATPVYVADEVRAFLAKHPRTLRPEMTEREVALIKQLNDQGVSVAVIAATVGCSPPTVYRYLGRTSSKPTRPLGSPEPRR